MKIGDAEEWEEWDFVSAAGREAKEKEEEEKKKKQDVVF